GELTMRGAATLRRGWNGLRTELRAALRRSLRQPGFAVVAGLTFALGVAGTVLFFGVLDQVYLRPLPFPDPDRLGRLRVSLPTAGGGSYLANVMPDEVRFLAERARSFDRIVAQRAEQLTLLGEGEPLALRGASVSPGTLAVFGFHPEVGRLFDAEEE